VEYERRNRLGGGAAGSDRLEELIPGLGATLQLSPALTLFAGVHRGFAPPRVEDAITAAGGSVELDPERSWNSELGLRYSARDGLRAELTAFDLDFENQIVPASVAGGTGATLTSAGRTRHRGVELSAQFDAGDVGGTALDAYVRTALTWLARAEYVGERYSAIPGFAAVSVRGNRLPYSPETLATVGFGIEAPPGLAAEVEISHASDAYTDDLNTVPVTADGQRGRIDAHTVVNLTVSQRLGDALTVYGSVKNLADRRYVADMSRGLIPGTPRQLQFGVDWRF
jgi:Fe(3+) dicitrate transport protein